jgi:thiol-disulfide isomerase/thioredoxin
MKKLLLVLVLALPYLGFSQEWADDSNVEDIISGKSAFGEDEPLVIVEFWAKFNDSNSFADWKNINIPYVRVDISKAPAAKKKYRVRMAPTIILFRDGFKEVIWKAGLDLECPVTLKEIKKAIEDANAASQF